MTRGRAIRPIAVVVAALTMATSACANGSEDVPTSAYPTGSAEVSELALPDAAGEKMPPVSVIIESLDCAMELPVEHDPLSNAEGSGQICILDASGGAQVYVMQREDFPTAVLGERTWGAGDPIVRLLLFEDGYVVGPFDELENIEEGALLAPNEWKGLVTDISASELLPEVTYECRSILSTALASDFRFAAGDKNSSGWVDSSQFDYGGGAGTELVEQARSSLEAGGAAELVDAASDSPGIMDYAAESYSSRYGPEVTEACGADGR